MESTKLAILHLATAAEQFIKSRLMQEHWALVLTKPGSVSFEQLESGNFITVVPEEAIERLNCVVLPEERIQPLEKEILIALAKERNKVAHFFHPSLETSKAEVAKLQTKVWFILRELLEKRWSGSYPGFNTKRTRVRKLLLAQHAYLETAFENMKAEIAAAKKSGALVDTCPACGFKSLILPKAAGFIQSCCKVCELAQDQLRVKCPSCGKRVVLTEGWQDCICGQEFSPAALIDLLDLHLGEWHERYEHINCQACGDSTVFPISEGRFACLNCMEFYGKLHECDYCGEAYCGKFDPLTSVYGCCAQFCRGRHGGASDD